MHEEYGKLTTMQASSSAVSAIDWDTESKYLHVNAKDGTDVIYVIDGKTYCYYLKTIYQLF